MVVGWAATNEARTGSYNVRGSVTAITLDIGEADLQIVGGGSQAALQVSHTDRFSFNHPAEAERGGGGATGRPQPHPRGPSLFHPPGGGGAGRARRRAAAALALSCHADRQLL